MNIYIGNLHVNASEEQVSNLFKKYGNVESVNIIIDKHSGDSRGFGFVEMDEQQEGAAAIEKLNNTKFMNQVIEVSEAMPREPKDTQFMINVRSKKKLQESFSKKGL